MKPGMILAALWLASNSALAVDMTAYGFEIGKPLNLPECPLNPTGSYRSYGIVRSICFQVSLAKREDAVTIETPGASIHFPFEERPYHSAADYMTLLAFDGKLQLLILRTAGQLVQNEVLSDLSRKYGAPTQTVQSPTQDQHGVEIVSIVATWDFPETLRVEYLGVFPGPDEGQIQIGTPAGFAELARRRADADEALKRLERFLRKFLPPR